MDKINELKDCVEKISKEAYKFFQKNNKTSGVRARKRLQKCKKLAQEIRLMIQKSKQDQVQKKSAVAAASAAVSGADILNEQLGQQNSEHISKFKDSSYNLFDGNDDARSILSNDNSHNDFFFQERNRKETSPHSIGVFQNSTRLNDIPTWSGNRINLFN